MEDIITFDDPDDYIEKRSLERIKNNTALTLWYNDNRSELEGICIDISSKGFGIIADHALPIGTQCNLKIHDGRSHKTKFQALVEIVRATDTVDDNGEERYILGASILQTY